MSGIFGIFNFDGQPVARESLEAMRDSMAYWGPDGSAIWQDGPIGLGHLLLHNTPQANGESLPLRDPASGVVLTAHARIDNREELIGELQITNYELGIRKGESSAIPDGALMLQAYLHWGEDCVHHLVGDWAFAAWDPHRRTLFIARDPCGISSLYTYRSSRCFAFASCIKALLALPEVPQRPNLFRIAQVLTSWPGDGIQTAYEEIYQLPPAHTLTVTPEKVESRQYWFLEEVPPVRLGSDEAYVEAFLEVYAEAVRCRTLRAPLPRGEGLGVRGEQGVRVCATLSSGLDSGSVCALAARELRARGERLLAFTSVPLYPTEGLVSRNRYGDEAPLVEIERRFIGALDVQYIRSEIISPLDGILRGLELHDSPGHAAGNTFWIDTILQTVQEQGFAVLLTGQIGNATVSWKGGAENYWPLLLSGRWGTLFDKAKQSGLSPWKVVKRYLLRPILLPLRNQVTRVRALGRDPWADYSAVNLTWARSLDLTQQMRSEGHDPLFIPPTDPTQARKQLLKPGSSSIGTIWAENGAGYGIEVRDPTMDKRLTEFCMAIPDEQYRLDGQDRALIRRATQGLLPDEVRLNTRRGRQAADLGHRLLAELPRVQAMLAQLEGSELAREVLDLPKMNGVLQALQKEVNKTATEQSMTILTRGLMVGLFLLRF